MAVPTVEVCYQATVTSLRFLDLEEAQDVYGKISNAVKSFKRFSNDRTETVEIEARDKGIMLFKLENIEHVILNTGASFEAELRKQLETEKLARAIREELGLPELPRR